MPEIFKSKPVRAAFWVQFLIIIASALHFFAPEPGRRRNKHDGRVIASAAVVAEGADGMPSIVPDALVPDAAGLRAHRVRIEEVTDSRHDNSVDSYTSRIYATDERGTPMRFGNYNNFRMEKNNAGEFSCILYHYRNSRELVDVYVIGLYDERKKMLPNVMAIYTASGTRLITAKRVAWSSPGE